jgi:hypothetical protein
MTLSERLAAAERARSGAANEEARAPVSGPTTSGPEVLPSDMTVLLAPQNTVAAVTPDPAVPRHAVCPTCGRTGELGLVDLARRTGDWSCDTCGTLWRISQR